VPTAFFICKTSKNHLQCKCKHNYIDMDIKIFSGSSHPEFAQQICQKLGVELGESESLKFSNDNYFVKVKEPVRGKDVFFIQTSTAPVHDHLMELLMYVRTFRDSSAGRITAVIPYFPYVRSDKKDQPRICITARLVADMLKTAGADRVIIAEMHSMQLQGFFSIPTDHILAAPTTIKYIKENWDLKDHIIVAADSGAAKMVKLYADGLNLPVVMMDKRRDNNDEQPEIKGVIGNVEGKKCLIIDDEVSSGRTLIRDTEFLLNHAGAKEVDVCVAHPVLGGNAVKELNDSLINKFLFTDTIPLEDKKIKNTEIVSLVPVFAETIKRIHENESIKSINDL